MTKSHALQFSTLIVLLHLPIQLLAVGVNYEQLVDNLPPPADVAHFIMNRTSIDRVKIYDYNPDAIRAFANTGILLSITIPATDIPSLADPKIAREWIRTNVKPFYPDTKIHYICVGSEVLYWGNQDVVSNLVPAMKSVHAALVVEGLGEIKVTTAHATNVMNSSDCPSKASFLPMWKHDVFDPLLHFHRETRTPFMVNPYPFYSWSPENNRFTLFRSNPGVLDRFTGKMYYNMYDVLLDSVYSSMKKLGYEDVDIVVGEIGWPSYGGPTSPQCTVENARWHNLNVINKSDSGVGTPLMPRRNFETYIFGLFNENQRAGYEYERNFGLFRPDFSPVYDIGLMRGGYIVKH